MPDPGNPQSLNRYAYVLNSPINFSDPTGHRPCGFACPDDAITHDILFGAAWEGDWDIQQQATNVARAETIARAASETTAGILWEPADWAIALSDGLQWYDGISFLPLVPATVGKYGDEVAGAAVKTADDLGVASFKELKRYTRGTGLEVHHIVEKRFARTLGTKESEMLSVVLGPAEHRLFTESVRNNV